MSAGRHVLIVEDDPDMTAVVRRACKRAGRSTKAFATVADLLEEPDLSGEPLIFLDLILADGNGIDILRILAARRSTAVIYLMSGQDDRLLNTVLRLGVSYGLDIRGVLTKPFALADLNAILDEPLGARPAPLMRATRVEELNRAIISDELYLHYQPKIDIASGAVVGCEALVRWLHPEHGIIPPGDFLPLAEELGLMGVLTHWVMNEALRQIAAWDMLGLTVDVAVNMPADMLNDLALPGLIQQQLTAHALGGARLTLEVTEAAVSQNMLTAMDVLIRLRLMGVGLSIDDFGTGHSSIVRLRQLPFSELKIDGSFVQGLCSDADNDVLVGAMINIGHRFKMKTVGEGVEQPEELARLTALGCDIVQGYHFSRPLPPDDFVLWMNRHEASRSATGLA